MNNLLDKATYTTVQSVHLCEELIHHPFANTPSPTAPVAPTSGTQAIQLVEEDDTGTAASRPLEYDSYGTFALAHVLV
jgi:hypothetical protein